MSQLYEQHIQLNSLKINKIKNLMNELNNKSYIDYLYDLLEQSYPIIKDKKNIIMEILLDINKYDIHPMIIQQIFSNFIYSCHIDNIQSLDQDYITLLSNITNEVEIAMSIFYNIFEEIDQEFINIENEIGYNELCNLTLDEFNRLLDDEIKKEFNQKNILNMMLVQIDKMIPNDILDDINDNIYETIKQRYIEMSTSIYKSLKRFHPFNKIDEIDILKLLEKHFIYYWIEYITKLNMNLIQEFLPNK
jgi:hypothetical protein